MEDAFSNWLNVLMVLKSLVISSDTPIPGIPVSKIALTSFMLMPPKPIIGVSVFKASAMAVYPFKPKAGLKWVYLC